MVFGQLDIHMQRMNLYLSLRACIKVSSKWIRDQNVRTKTVKLLKENLSGKLCDIGLDTDLTPKTQAAKTK